MKFKLLFLIIFSGCLTLRAQETLPQLLAAGVDDAKKFSEDYISPASAAVVYNLSNSWYNTAKAKNLGQFEISIVGNASFVSTSQKSFELNTSDYNYLQFEDPTIQQMQVATALGENDPNIKMIIEHPNIDGSMSDTEITLPQGLSSAGVSIVPSTFLQVNVGLLKGTEVKLRFLPKITIEGVSTNFYGGAIQHEITSWIPGEKVFPLHISALVGYTKLEGSYNLKENHITEGNNQKIQTATDSWLFTTIFSTKLPVINFYGGLGYVYGSANTDLKGNYQITEGVLSGQTITDPFSISNKFSGVKATVGTKLTLGFFRFNVDYSFQEFNNLHVGLNFGI